MIVLLGAMLCGASASAIWVAQGAYVSQVAGETRRTELFGLFWMLMMSSQIIGNLITTFVLGLVSNTVYFLVLTILGSTLFRTQPPVPSSFFSSQMFSKMRPQHPSHCLARLPKLLKSSNRASTAISFYTIFSLGSVLVSMQLTSIS